MRKQKNRFYHFYLGRELKHWTRALFGFGIIVATTVALLAVGWFTGVDLERLLEGLVVSFGRVMLAYAISLVLGILIAFFVTRSEAAENFFLPIFETAQSLPTVAILPLVILWLGSQSAIIFLLVITMIWPITFSVVNGFKSIPHSLSETARIYGAKGWKKLRYFTLPMILPSMITGSIIGWGEGWEVLVAAELLGAQSGIGAYIGEAAHQEKTIIMVMAITFLMFIIFLLNKWVWVPLLKQTTKHQL